MKKDAWMWIGLAGAAAVGYYAYSQGLLQNILPAPATPLSIYPELAYTALPATTSMSATAKQQAPAAVVPASPLYVSVQGSEQSAILAQCVGSNVCSPLAGDTQLGI